MSELRIPFAAVIDDPRALKPHFETLSLPQQTALKVLYGCELSAARIDDRGFSELDYWAASQGAGAFDELGYLTKAFPQRVPYVPREYREGWGIWGVRSGKSDRFAATIVAYEAVFGGHEAEKRRGRPAVCFQVAQDLRQARYSIHSIKATLESIAFLTQPYGKHESRILNVTADTIELWNEIVVMTTPPTVKSVRGYDAPCAVLDEIGIWATESDSANPDFAVYSQVSSRQAQFENPKIVGISSPWGKTGLLHQRALGGTDGLKLRCPLCRTRPQPGCQACAVMRRPHRGRLVMHLPTAALANPLVRRDFLQDEYDKDPRTFAREYKAEFQDSISGFLNSELVRGAVDPGVLERVPEPRNYYIAAIDPAFKHDSFAFAIGHAAEDGSAIVFDLVREWKPRWGETLNPEAMLREIAPLVKQYRVFNVLSDQYQFESLGQLAMQHGFSLEPVKFTAISKGNIYGNLRQLVNTRRLRLLDHPETVKQLCSLEHRLTQGGLMQIAAPQGEHDDCATVIALVAHGAVWMLPEKPPAAEQLEKTPFELCMATVRKKRTVPDDD